MKYKKCLSCKYNKRPTFSYPCSRCNEDEVDTPVTCRECIRWCNGCDLMDKYARRMMPCENFEWS